jgi:WD repeat-containing protein 61
MLKPTKRAEGAHREGVLSLSWLGDRLVSGSLDGCVKLWDVGGGASGAVKAVAETKPFSLGVVSCASFSDGSKVVCGSQDGSIAVLDSAMLHPEARVDAGLQEAWTVCVSPGDDVLASGNHRGAVNVWSSSDLQKVASLETGCGFILNLAFSPDATRLACVGMDGALNILDLASQKVLHRIDAHALPARSVKFLPGSGDLVLSASDDRHVSAFDARVGVPVNSFSHPGMALCLDVSCDERHFAVGCSDHSVSVWDLGMQRAVHRFDTQHAASEPVWAVAYNASGQRLASAGEDSLIQIYEP